VCCSSFDRVELLSLWRSSRANPSACFMRRAQG
jgi:hypothetical protein